MKYLELDGNRKSNNFKIMKNLFHNPIPIIFYIILKITIKKVRNFRFEFLTFFNYTPITVDEKISVANYYIQLVSNGENSVD